MEEYQKLITLIIERKSLREVQRAYVDYVLAMNSGNKLRTARDLEVDRRSIQRWSKGQKACA